MVGNPILNISIFAVFIILTLVIVVRVSRGSGSQSGFYAGGRSFSGRQNGVAIAGDYLSAASFLGIAGSVALYGYDGLLYSIGFLVAWLVALLLVAEPLRNTGKYTMADVLSFRMQQKPVRVVAALSTLMVSFFYLLAQMSGAGSLVALLLQVKSKVGQGVVIAIVGIVMIAYVRIGGMKGTTWVQIIKAVLLIAGASVMTIWVLTHFGFNLSSMLGEVAKTAGEANLNPGAQYTTGTKKLAFISLAIALVFGAAGLPHVLMRFYTVPTAKEARRSVTWAIALIGAFYLLTVIIGYGASVLVSKDDILNAPGKSNSAAPLLAFHLGGEVLLAVISGVAFATILAVVAGLTITASASLAHDIYNSVLRDGKATPEAELRVARTTTLVIGAVAIVGGIATNGVSVAFLVSLAFAIAASANLPSILFSLYWKRFNTRGTIWSMTGGLVSAVVLIIFSPVVSGKDGIIKSVDFHWFPLDNPAIVSVPLGFALAVIGTLTSPAESPEKQAEMEVRSMTGVGAEKAISH